MRTAALTGAFCLAFAGSSALAEEARTTPSGYVFEQPELLADQLLWGIAHGARLLGLACAKSGHGAAAEAWLAWREREATEIAAYHARLARHYFERDDAQPAALAAALGLKPELELSAENLAQACATLAEALAQPRYDLARRRAEMLRK